jgi:hypothetical protein
MERSFGSRRRIARAGWWQCFPWIAVPPASTTLVVRIADGVPASGDILERFLTISLDPSRQRLIDAPENA